MTAIERIINSWYIILHVDLTTGHVCCQQDLTVSCTYMLGIIHTTVYLDEIPVLSDRGALYHKMLSSGSDIAGFRWSNHYSFIFYISSTVISCCLNYSEFLRYNSLCCVVAVSNLQCTGQIGSIKPPMCFWSALLQTTNLLEILFFIRDR